MQIFCSEQLLLPQILKEVLWGTTQTASKLRAPEDVTWLSSMSTQWDKVM